MADDHDRLLDQLISSHTIFGVFDTSADELTVFQLWSAPPADDDLLPGPDYRPPWKS